MLRKKKVGMLENEKLFRNKERTVKSILSRYGYSLSRLDEECVQIGRDSKNHPKRLESMHYVLICFLILFIILFSMYVFFSIFLLIIVFNLILYFWYRLKKMEQSSQQEHESIIISDSSILFKDKDGNEKSIGHDEYDRFELNIPFNQNPYVGSLFLVFTDKRKQLVLQLLSDKRSQLDTELHTIAEYINMIIYPED